MASMRKLAGGLERQADRLNTLVGAYIINPVLHNHDNVPLVEMQKIQN